MAARLKALDKYQKFIILVCVVMAVVFSVLYPVTISRVGFLYQDTILVPEEVNGGTIYTGKIKGQPATITVSNNKTVKFSCGEKVYGPYTAKEDPTAIPKDEDMAQQMRGVELRCDGKVIFRGAALPFDDSFILYHANGEIESIGIHYTVTSESGTVYDKYGNEIDPLEPSFSIVLKLMGEPELTHKGSWLGWFGGVAFCILTAFLILYADEMFRWNMSFRIRDVDRAEPSEWEITSRYIEWTMIPIFALVAFIMGLR